MLFCHLSHNLERDNVMKKKEKKTHPWVHVSIMKEQQWGEVIRRQSNLVSWDIYVILFNKSATVVTDLTGLESCSETCCVSVRLNVSKRWTEELTLFCYRDPAVSPSKHFLTFSLTTWHDFCPEHNCR